MFGGLKPADKLEGWLLGICSLAVLLYLYNLIAGKLHVIDVASLPRLSDVHEFLLLTVAVAAFILWTMRKEATEKRRGQ